MENYAAIFTFAGIFNFQSEFLNFLVFFSFMLPFFKVELFLGKIGKVIHIFYFSYCL